MSIGRIGVQIFFVISGFVIAYSARKASTGSFLRSRVLRLVPAAWICATISLAVATFADNRGAVSLIASWVRSVVFFPKGEYIDGSYWTLGIECAFYAIVLMLIACNALRHLEKAFGVIALVSALFSATALVIRPELGGLVSNRALQLMLVVHGSDFAVGIFLWGLLFEGVSRLRVAGLMSGLIGGGIEVFYWVPLPQYRIWGVAIWLLSIAAIAASVRFNDRLQVRLSDRALALIRNAGLTTYPLYLLHDLIGAALMKQLAAFGVSQSLSLGAVLFAITTAAYLIATHAEPMVRSVLAPAMNLVQRRIDCLSIRPA